MKKSFIKLYKNQGNLWIHINNILKNGSINDYEKLASFVEKNPHIKKQLNMFLFPKNLEILRTPYFFGVNPVNIAIWNCFLINKNISKINNFNKLKSSYENEFLLGNYDKAKLFLEKAEELYGNSLWLLENKLLLNKIGCSNYNLKNKSGIERLLISYLEIKSDINEKNIYYPERMEKTIENNIKDKSIVSFLKYYLLVKRPDNTEWDSILLLISQLSLIDIFLVTKDMLLDIKNFSISVDVLDKMFSLLDGIEDKVVSYNVDKNLKRINDVNYDTSLYKAITNFDNNSLLYDEFIENPTEFINSVYGYKILAISKVTGKDIAFPNDSISKHIFKLIYSILSKKNLSSFAHCIEDLLTFSRVYSSFYIGKSLLLFINDILDTNMLFSNEMFFSSYDDYLLKKYINKSDSLYLYPEKNIEEIEFDKYLLWISNNIDINCDLYNYYRILQIQLEMKKAETANDKNTALNIAINAYIENELFVFSININSISNFINNKIKNSNDLSLEEICFLYIDNNLSDYIKSSAMNYLDNDVNPFCDPIELVSNFQDRKISEFFLYHVCNLDFIKGLYWLINTDEESMNYRIKILKFLLETNSIIDDKVLNTEINELTKRLILKKRVQKINSSRIMIESSKIWQETEDRLLALIKKYNSTNENDRYIFEYDMNNPANIIYIPARIYILQEIYYCYANEFCFGKYGIDDSLSTRVRHGAFTNHIINVFSESGIISKDDKKSFFEDLISAKKLTQEASIIIDSFIKKTSELLEYTKKHSLKVKIYDDIPGAIFDYNLTTEDEIYFSRLHDEDYLTTESISILLNEIILNKTNSLLFNVRNELLPDILKKLNLYLDELYEGICNCKTKKDNNIDMEINKLVIDCKSSLDRAFTEISKWFYLSEINTWEDYSFADLLETTNEVNKKLFFNYSSINISMNETDYLLNGKTFRNFTDIFLILFNNAIVHSELSNELSNLNININVFENNDEISFTFSNNVSINLDIDLLDEKISSLNNIVTSKEYLNVEINNEGGMGLYKIMNLIFVINQYGKNIYFFRKDNTFNVCITFRKDYIINEKNLDS